MKVTVEYYVAFKNSPEYQLEERIHRDMLLPPKCFPHACLDPCVRPDMPIVSGNGKIVMDRLQQEKIGSRNGNQHIKSCRPSAAKIGRPSELQNS